VTTRRSPGVVRDAIINYLRGIKGDASVAEIRTAVNEMLGEPVPDSSIRSYLNINTPTMFLRTSRGRYRLVRQ
jgi:site-specific DNA-methyltransferase (adenine-specific)